MSAARFGRVAREQCVLGGEPTRHNCNPKYRVEEIYGQLCSLTAIGVACSSKRVAVQVGGRWSQVLGWLLRVRKGPEKYPAALTISIDRNCTLFIHLVLFTQSALMDRLQLLLSLPTLDAYAQQGATRGESKIYIRWR